MKKLNINESFISRIWESPSYYESRLMTCDNKTLEVLDFGEKNSDAGPDFIDAKIRLDGKLYSGDIEIHRDFKGWKQHNHKGDNKYNKVILQVVFWDEDDEVKKKIPRVKKSRDIPTIILSNFLKQSIHIIWKDIINNPSPKFKLPCFPNVKEIEADFKTDVIRDFGFKRLKYKTIRLRNRLDDFQESRNKKFTWQIVLFEFICEALGYSKNKAQFLKLARSFQYEEFENDKLFLDAVLFGAAGFLHDLKYKDEYISLLKVIWNETRNKRFPETLDKSEWNFFRLRPPNFPTVRLAYASGLLYKVLFGDFLKEIINIFNNERKIHNKLIDLFLNVEISGYWKNHYNFGKETKSKTKYIGKERVNDIITNVIIPLVYLYTIEFEIQDTKQKVLEFYSNLKCINSNEITRTMEAQLNVKPKTVSDEQGLIHLHNFYCIKGKCSECVIGERIFNEAIVSEPLKIIVY
ncbi:MAG: DUF2851 family protein [Bacteroidetes bacterium]|nr:DUF2851 family protein [Bacteroidota bacterium]